MNNLSLYCAVILASMTGLTYPAAACTPQSYNVDTTTSPPDPPYSQKELNNDCYTQLKDLKSSAWTSCKKSGGTPDLDELQANIVPKQPFGSMLVCSATFKCVCP